MLSIKVMLSSRLKSLRTGTRMLIAQDMLITEMLIARFYCKRL